MRAIHKRLREILSSYRVGKAVTFVGLYGVPLYVIVFSGGLHTTWFWIGSLLMLCAAAFQASLVGSLLLVPAVLLGAAIGALTRGRLASVAERIWDRVQLPFAILYFATVTGVVFVTQLRVDPPPDIRLPTASDNLGTLIVMYGGLVAAVGLVWLGSHLDEGWPNRARARNTPRIPESDPRPIAPWVPPPPPPPPPPPIPEPDETFHSFEAVRAWRAWKWQDGTLHGVFEPWPDPEFEAVCDEPHNVPYWSHGCGIYCVKESGDVHRFLRGPEVVGLVEMWGDVIEHEHGYRASHVRIIRLWTGSPTVASSLAAKYGVEVSVGQPQKAAAVNDRSEAASLSLKGAPASPPSLENRAPYMPAQVGSAYWSAEPVAAWRGWFWDGSVLRGAVTEWPESWLVATCPDCAEPPTWSCRCGIHGVKDRDAIARMASGPRNVEGRVELWGNVIEVEGGYRASHARIVELWADWSLVDEIRERYPDVKVRAVIDMGRNRD